MRGSDVRALGRPGVPAALEGEQILAGAPGQPRRRVGGLHRADEVDAAVAVAQGAAAQFDPGWWRRSVPARRSCSRGLDDGRLAGGDRCAADARGRALRRGLDSALEAIADFTDLKSPWTIGHSRGVADLAFAAAQA